MNRVRRYLAALAVAGNQLLNAVTGGSPNEAMSSRLGHAREHGNKFAKVACAVLEKINTGKPQAEDHCAEAMATHDRRMKEELERNH
jgi:hypothetical protein